MGITPDFQVLYLASKDFLAGLNFYQNKEIFTGVGYPPISLIFYSPFIILPYGISQTLFFILSLFATALSVYLSIKILLPKSKLWHFLLILILTLIFFPTKFTLGMGQVNAITLLVFLFSYYLYQKGKKELSGTFLGLAICLKPIFGFFLLFYLIKKKYKTTLYALGIITILFIVSILIGGIDLYRYYLEKIIPLLLNITGREIYYNQGLMGFISRLTTDNNLRKILWEIGSLIFIIITSLFTIKKGSKNLQFALFIITLLLIDSLSWQHHFVWLIFPFIVIGREIFKRKRVVLTTLFVLSYLLVFWNFKNQNLNFGFLNPIIFSHVFIGTIILYLLNLILSKKEITS